MKTKSRFGSVLAIFILFCSTSLYAQNSFSPADLMGEWTYYGPDSIKINDTISLSKELSDKTDYKRWTFKSDNEFIVTGLRLMEKASILSKSVNDKWYYNSESNRLLIKRHNRDQYFKILSFQEPSLKLILIK